jgi:acyl carrier protein
MSTVYEQLSELMVERFLVDPENLTPEATFEDLGMDSLFLVELILEVQRVFNVKIDEDAATPTDTVGHAVALIEEQISTAATVQP